MDFNRMREIANNDVDVLIEKGKKYGDSWKKRGGIGAFMMLARKTDRMEVAVGEHGYDIFAAIEADNFQEDGLLDDIADLRRYLFLVETEMRMRMVEKTFSEESFETYSKGVEELNEIKEKEALLDKADAEVMKARYVETPPGAFETELDETPLPGGLPASVAFEEAVRDMEASVAEKEAVPIYIDFIEIPPDDFDHAHPVKNSWAWTREEEGRSSVLHWPSSYKALMCPARAGLKWLHKGKLYTITENSTPVIIEGKWVWEVLAIPDKETTTLEASPYQAPGTGFK